MRAATMRPIRRPIMSAALLSGLLTIALAAHSAVAMAQKKPKDNISGYDRAARATLVHPAIVYVSPDDNAQHIAEQMFKVCPRDGMADVYFAE